MNAYSIPGCQTTPESLAIIAAKVYQVPVEMLYTVTKKRNIAECRGVAFFLIRNILNQSLLSIGVPFRTDHSTVSYWCKKIKDLAQVDKEVRLKFIKACQGAGVPCEIINGYLK